MLGRGFAVHEVVAQKPFHGAEARMRVLQRDAALGFEVERFRPVELVIGWVGGEGEWMDGGREDGGNPT
jgi:hypothetical protein